MEKYQSAAVRVALIILPGFPIFRSGRSVAAQLYLVVQRERKKENHYRCILNLIRFYEV